MKRTLVSAMVVFINLLICTPTDAALQIFLKFDGIDGESTAQGHEKWIDVTSYSWSVSNYYYYPFLQDFTVTKHTDASTPKLFHDLLTSTPISSATLDVINNASGTQPDFEFSFSNVLLTNLYLNGDATTSTMETLSFNFSKVTLTDFPVDATGRRLPPITATWDGSFFNPIPEPSAWMMIALGGLLVLARRCKSASLDH